jgi:predicted anti-sigma-YlaC factor YlaD
MEGMNIAVWASLEGCLPDEYFPKRCRNCGAWFDAAAEAHELYCPRCTMTKPVNDVPEEEE